jgi:serine/threonine-protein kinase HipA
MQLLRFLLPLARWFGLFVGKPLTYRHNALFIPRFDRDVQSGHVERYGMESLCSLAGIAEYGASPTHDILCQALAKYATNPGVAVKEYVLRDVLNIALGNKDNHARNTAVLKYPDGRIELSPLFDFAPMYLDPEGIARVCRWNKNSESGGQPTWGKVAESLSPYVDVASLKQIMLTCSQKLNELPDLMRLLNVDDRVIETRIMGLTNLAQSFKELKS